ncbi:arginine deiminase-related protein [Bosea lupini]|uniref:arginine deiminase-related protein n=1 Tax=Bosea lupini TaxID=1036779 RepID=UPI001160DBE2|nr:arginine deiminase-related protein [Bosea lupini]
MELQGRNGRVLAFPTMAFSALTSEQLRIIGESARPLPLALPTIERAGGSTRCTIAGVHLNPRSFPSSE